MLTGINGGLFKLKIDTLFDWKAQIFKTPENIAKFIGCRFMKPYWSGALKAKMEGTDVQVQFDNLTLSINLKDIYPTYIYDDWHCMYLN